MVFKSILTGLVLVAVASGVARAGTLTTPPLPGGPAYRCQAVNIGTRARQIDLSILAANSGSIAKVSCMGVLPGHICTLNGSEFSSYCVITVNGSKNSVRGSFSALTGDVVTGVVAAQ